jgi:ubiquinone/menaquinone biosynthesis C-methylase UbiE
MINPEELRKKSKCYGKDIEMNKFNDKSKAAYNKKADDYDNTHDGRFTQKFKRLLVENIVLTDNYNTLNVLDVACGNGSLLSLLNKKKPIKGFGVDISDQMIKNASAKNPDMEFRAAGCEAIPFADNSMDLITVSSSYHHFPDVTAFAKEAKRLLKPNGKLYIAEVYLPDFLRLICNPFVPLSKAGDVRFYSPNEIVNNFKPFGFEKTDVKISENVQIVSMQKIQKMQKI